MKYHLPERMTYFARRNGTAPFYGIGYVEPECDVIHTPDFGGRTRSGRVYSIARAQTDVTGTYYKMVDEFPTGDRKAVLMLWEYVRPILERMSQSDDFDSTSSLPDIIAAVREYYVIMRENHLLFDPYAQNYFGEETDFLNDTIYHAAQAICDELIRRLRKPLTSSVMKARGLRTDSDNLRERYAALQLLDSVQYAFTNKDWGFAKN